MQIVEKETYPPFHTIHLDHFSSLAVTDDEYKHVLVIIDAYTRFVWLFLVKSTGTEEVLLSLRSPFAMFGNPQRIIIDRRTVFLSSIFANYIKEIKAKHIRITAVALPWANGQVERHCFNFLETTK